MRTGDGKLAIRDVTVARRRDETVLVSEGLAPGEAIITSRVATPVEGMRIRVDGEGPEGEPDGEVAAARAVRGDKP